jgi:hypothetical protein
VIDDDDDDDNNNNTYSIIVVCNLFKLCMGVLRPFLCYGSRNVRAEANKCIKKLGAKCCEMLRTFPFVLMLLSPSSVKLIFQHKFEILYDPTRYLGETSSERVRKTAKTLPTELIITFIHP